MSEQTWPLVVPNDDGIRPAGKPDQCLYCKRVIGQEHARDCVVVTKRIRVEFTVTYEVDVPHSWTAEDVESRRNNGSWCADNALEEIANFFAEDGGCLCGNAKTRFVEVTDSTPRREVQEAL